MNYGRAHTNSILRVKYENGIKWYRVSKGRDIGSLIKHFGRLSFFLYFQLFEYKSGHGVGRKYFYYTKNGSSSFL